MQHKVVFLCDYSEALRSTVLPLAGALAGEGTYQPHVLVERATDSMLDMCRATEIEFTIRSRAAAQNRDQRPVPPPPGTLAWSANLVVNVAKSRQRIRKLSRELSRHHPRAVILLDDRTLFTSRWVKAAQRLRLPTIVVQWAAVHQAQTMIALRAAQQRGRTPPRLVNLCERRFAQWVPQAVGWHDGRRVWFLPSDQAVAGWWSNSLPRITPWSFGGGNADVVAALGAGWKRRMVAGGVPADKIVVTGHPDQDRWYQARQRAARCVPAVRSSLGIPVGRRLVTIAAPALAMRGARGSRRGDISLADLSASLRDAVAAVAQLGSEWLPVVKVHPRDAVGDLSFLTDAAPDVRIVHDVATDDLIVASEAMACQWSTTALIGPAVGTPVVLFDFHDSTSAEVWRGIPGLPVAKSPANFSHLLREVLLQPSSRDKLRQQQRAFVNDYLCCDGRCTQRLVELVLRRSESHSTLRAA